MLWGLLVGAGTGAGGEEPVPETEPETEAEDRATATGRELDGPSLLERAVGREDEGDEAGAEADLAEALARFRDEGDTAGERRALVRRGLLRGRMGRLSEAVADLEAAIPLADGGLDREAPPRIRRQIAELYLARGRPVDALPWADASLIAAAVSGRSEFAARPCQTYLEVATTLAGDDTSLLGALQHADRRLAAMEGYAGPASLPELLFGSGAGWLAEGDLNAARSGMHLAVRAADILAEPAQLPPYLISLAYVDLERGELPAARRAVVRCLELPGGRTVASLSTLGTVQQREGWLDEALASYDAAMEQARAERELAELGPLLGRRADVLELAGRPEEARRERTRALRELGDEGDAAEIIRQQVRLARLLVVERRWEEAEDLAMRSLGNNRDPVAVPDAPVRYLSPVLAAEALLVLASMHATREEFDEARRELTQAETTLVRAGRLADLGRVIAAQAALELLASQEDSAAEILGGLPPDSKGHWQVLHARALDALNAGDRVLAEDRLAEAQRVLDAEGGGLPWEVHAPLLPASAAVRDARIRVLGEDGRARDLLAMVLSMDDGPADIEIPEDGAVLVLAVTEGATWLALIRGGESAVSSSGLGRDTLRPALAAFCDLPAAGTRPRQLGEWQTTSDFLYVNLVLPFEGRLSEPGVERLVIAADPEFAGAPLGAVWHEGTFLAQRLVISRAPRGGAVPPAFEGKRRSRAASAYRDVGGEPPRLVEELELRIKATEVLPVGSFCAGEGDGSPPVIHLACPVEENPLRSASTRLAAPARPDLDLHGLARCALTPRVVVLDTGDARTDPGVRRAEQDVAGALVAGGAPAVLVAPPADLEAAGIYREFLKTLDRLGPARALQRAQSLWFLDGAPADWAGWEVVSW